MTGQPTILSGIPSNLVRLLVAQDILRTQAHSLLACDHRLKLLALCLAFVSPFAQIFASGLQSWGIAVAAWQILATVAVLSVLAEFASRWYRDLSTRAHLVSRRALAIALPCDALGVDANANDIQSLAEQFDLFPTPIALEEHYKVNASRFTPWWISQRPNGIPRISALVLDNLSYTIPILERSSTRSFTRVWRIYLAFAVVLAIAIIFTPNRAGILLVDWLIPIFLFLLATESLRITQSLADYLGECKAIREQLRGIDKIQPTEAQQQLSITLLSRYLAVSSANGPVSSGVYWELFPRKNRQFLAPTHHTIETWLSP